MINILTANIKKEEYPLYKNFRQIDEDEKLRNEIIVHGINSFGYLIPPNTNFRLCYLGQKIKENCTDEKAILTANIMIINSYYLCPFYKSYQNKFTQI